MPGSVCCSLVNHLVAELPSRLPKSSPKSLFCYILPVSYLFPRFYARNARYLIENRDLRGRGVGGTSPHLFPFWESMFPVDGVSVGRIQVL